MNRSDWNAISVGDIILVTPVDRFFVTTVELVETDSGMDIAGEVYDRHSGLFMDPDLVDMADFKLYKCPACLPVINDKVVFPGDKLWPRKVWPYHPDATPEDIE